MKLKSGASLLCAALLLPAGFGACGGGSATTDAAEPPDPGELVLFVYDRSTSIPSHTLELAQQLTSERVMKLDHADLVGGMELLQLSLAEEPKRWSQRVPNREIVNHQVMRDSVARVRFLRDAVILLGQLASPAGRDDINGTDILSTLHDVGEELRAYPDLRATLYLFSDMLQSTREIEMEGLRAMPPDGWVARANEGGRLPNLSGLCVVVVGARVDTQAAQRVKAFWQEYFETTGATLTDQNYMLRPVRLPVDACASGRGVA